MHICSTVFCRWFDPFAAQCSVNGSIRLQHSALLMVRFVCSTVFCRWFDPFAAQCSADGSIRLLNLFVKQVS